MKTLTPAEAQALLDALDTLDGAGLTAVTADLDVLARAKAKLQRIVRAA